jgi:hypothetical protein
MTYELGFALGEAKAFKDRQRGRRTVQLCTPMSEGMRGYWDGYTPRSETWAAPVKAEEVTA